MLDDIWFTLHVNPEPWAVGTISGKRMSPDQNLVAYQNAVREALREHNTLPSTHRRLEFYFFRNVARYIDAGDRRRHRNQADATNMQKALEDALQGILFDNDREITDIRSVISMQGSNVDPMILIRAMPSGDPMFETLSNVPNEVMVASMKAAGAPVRAKNSWGEDDDF